MVVPDTIISIGNGMLQSAEIVKTQHYVDIPVFSKTVSLRWQVKNPINNYNIVPYIGKYVNFTDTFIGEKGKLDLSYWVLDYNLEKAKEQFKQVKTMLRCYEHWFGPYPFYEDSYKLVEAPHLGMEHQSAIAYGNKFINGYKGTDRSKTGWGLKWDFIIIHESGHEWFGNNITAKDIADNWIHESFTNYAETLYTEWLFGKQAADEYNRGLRNKIKNDEPIIGPYGVNKDGSGDMYDKGGNMIHIIRKVINDDEKLRQILRGLNKTFWHQTVTTRQIEDYIIQQSAINFQKTFDQYLRTTQIPQLELYFSKDKQTVFYRWTNCIKGFDLLLVLNNKRIPVTTKWNSAKVSKGELSGWDEDLIIKQYYITAKQVRGKR
jgi:aminopeptidase N